MTLEERVKQLDLPTEEWRSRLEVAELKLEEGLGLSQDLSLLYVMKGKLKVKGPLNECIELVKVPCSLLQGGD